MTRRFVACAGMALALTIAAWAAPPADAAGRDAVVDWSAGPVGLGTGYVQPGGSDRVREVQRLLRVLGYRSGPVDGMFGPRTARAALRFQRRSGLSVDGVVGARTLAALRSRDDVPSRARDVAPAPRPAPIASPAPRRLVPAHGVASGQGGPSAIVLALLVLAATATLAAGVRFRARRRRARARPDEIVARSAGELPPRWSRPDGQAKVHDRTDLAAAVTVVAGTRRSTDL
jgi:hypothetical protein